MSNRGFLQHKWFKLLDEEGRPINNATIYLYEYTGSTPTSADTLHIVTSAGIADSLPLTTDSNGVFEFYVKDHIKANAEGGWGYRWDTQYIIRWDKTGLTGGYITNNHLFGEYESVVNSGSNTSMNKAISNYIGKTIQNHIDFDCGV